MSGCVFPWDVMLMIVSYAASHSTPSIARTCKALCAFTKTPRYWQMSGCVFPWDVMLMIVSYAASHSTPSIARTCKALCAFTKTPRYWQYAVRNAVQECLRDAQIAIQPEQLASIDVFAMPPPAEETGLDLGVFLLSFRERLGWMFNRDFTRPLWEKPAGGRYYGSFAIWNENALWWRWSFERIDDMALRFGRLIPFNDYIYDHVTCYPLHPSARWCCCMHNGADKFCVFDSISKKTWIGQAIKERNHTTGEIVVRPKEGFGSWK